MPAPKTVLVTGSAGYVGSQTVLAFKDLGLRVIGLDDLSLGDSEAMAFADVVVKGDVRDSALLERLFATEPIHGIVHCAAFAIVGESIRDPVRYFRNNIEGITALIEAAVNHGRPAFVFSSSATVYGEPDRMPILETAPRLPIHPYGFSKLAGERALEFADRGYGLRSVSLRYFNAAGADPALRVGERHVVETRVLPNLLRAAIDPSAPPFSLAGDDWSTDDGTCVRDFVHTADIARAHHAALTYLWGGGRTEALNIGGGGSGTSVRELIAAVEAEIGGPARVEVGPRRPGDAPALVADIRRASAVLGWRPEHNLREIVHTARGWHTLERERAAVAPPGASAASSQSLAHTGRGGVS